MTYPLLLIFFIVTVIYYVFWSLCIGVNALFFVHITRGQHRHTLHFEFSFRVKLSLKLNSSFGFFSLFWLFLAFFGFFSVFFSVFDVSFSFYFSSFRFFVFIFIIFVTFLFNKMNMMKNVTKNDERNTSAI